MFNTGTKLIWCGLGSASKRYRKGQSMRPTLLEILACPICKNSLRLEISRENDTEILAGSLSCDTCTEIYLIEDGIPNLLPPELRSL